MKKKIIITIGREFGSGGLDVAHELGRKLGIPVYDNELITKAAQDSGFSAELFAQKDEKRSIFSFKAAFSSAADDYMSEGGLFNMQCETIRRIAEQGSAVIVGRCSNYVLRDLEDTIHIFLTSPMEVRTRRIMERHSLTEEKAESLISHKDKSREEYYNYYTFGNWGKASDYDICMDSSILGIEGTAEFIIRLAQMKGILKEGDNE